MLLVAKTLRCVVGRYSQQNVGMVFVDSCLQEGFSLDFKLLNLMSDDGLKNSCAWALGGFFEWKELFT